jgi:uncharacterized repeat protein (TIGR03837 family)
MTSRWIIFCSIIDNFGDIGVCWRLARQLANEHQRDVELWVDDWSALSGFLAAQIPGINNAPVFPEQQAITAAGVRIRHWHKPWQALPVTDQHIAGADVIIEAFGCELPASVKQAMRHVNTPVLWLNLEYLSAEAWVKECHGLPSPQNLSPLVKKFFFFPGFEQGTGGLLREATMISQHEQWQQEQQVLRQRLLQKAGLSEFLQADVLLVSLFSYDTPALASWLNALQEQTQKVVCFVPEGKSLAAVARCFSRDRLVPGEIARLGALTVVAMPFGSQTDYDQLLSLCDFNVVRGEDSFVRAQWAARPMLWHIYPQDDGVHLQKLEAFERLYLDGLNPDAAKAWQAFSNGWNQGEDCHEVWHHLRPQLSSLQSHARKWQKKLAAMPDLSANLVNFETLTKLSAHP